MSVGGWDGRFSQKYMPAFPSAAQRYVEPEGASLPEARTKRGHDSVNEHAVLITSEKDTRPATWA